MPRYGTAADETVIPFPQAPRTDAEDYASIRREVIEGLGAAIERMINILDRLEGDPDLEREEDIAADDLGEPDVIP